MYLPTRILVVVFAAFLLVGCQSNTEADDEPVETQTPEDDEETIADDDEKINDQNELEADGQTAECPPPAEPEGMCAQVVVWAMSPDGKCCQYPTPCHAPKDWETFGSEEECEAAAE